MRQPDLFDIDTLPASLTGGAVMVLANGRATLTPREKGRRAGAAALQAAERAGWDSDGARRFIVGWLRRHGRVAGEELVLQAKAHGFDPRRYGRDDRAFGPLFQALQRAGEIRCTRSDLPRSRGHGTSGGREWEAV